MTVYAYLRLSAERRADKNLPEAQRRAVEAASPEVQRRQVEGYCQMQGLVLGEVLFDDGVSGAVPIAERPAGGVLFGKLRRGDVVVAAKVDRMFRSTLDALTSVEDLRTRGVALHLLDLGGEVTAGGLSHFFLTMVAAFATLERCRIQERILASKANQKRNFRYLGGSVPFGWLLDGNGGLVPDPGEQAAVAMIVELSGKGASLREISESLAAVGVALSHNGVRSVLKREGLAKKRSRL